MSAILERLFIVGHLIAQLNEQSINAIQFLVLLVLHGVAVPITTEVPLGLIITQARVDQLE